MDILPLEVFAINLPKREDRKADLLNQFSSKSEFTLKLVVPVYDRNGARSLWLTIKQIIQDRMNEDFIIMCEDDHQFTESYNINFLLESIRKAKQCNADILLGGLSWSLYAIEASNSLFWIKKFTGLQFVVIFNKLFTQILSASFSEDDCADYKISHLAKNKFVMYPFISIQKDYGYSDVTIKNNAMGRVKTLFENSSLCLASLLKVKKYYSSSDWPDSVQEKYNGVAIPTYIINLPERRDRLEHIKVQFSERPEFQTEIVEACKHKIGAVGLWESIRKVIGLAIKNEDDVIIICEDDHQFTEQYDSRVFVQSILFAHQHGCDVLSGGIGGGFDHAIFINHNVFWINSFWSTQFVVIFKRFFNRILNEPFCDTDTADAVLSSMTSCKFGLYPFVSVQRDFGYSDVTDRNNKEKGHISTLFDLATKNIEEIRMLQQTFSRDLNAIN